jgi:hypothetical protein
MIEMKSVGYHFCCSLVEDQSTDGSTDLQAEKGDVDTRTAPSSTIFAVVLFRVVVVTSTRLRSFSKRKFSSVKLKSNEEEEQKQMPSS